MANYNSLGSLFRKQGKEAGRGTSRTAELPQ